MAQNPDPAHPFPLDDAPLTLPSGTTVRVRNLVVFQGRTKRQLTIMIETPTAATDTERLAREAKELANMHQQFAEMEHLDGITVAVCRTQACLETREVPSEMFRFVRGIDGHWTDDPMQRS
jgi:hypothetical protein